MMMDQITPIISAAAPVGGLLLAAFAAALAGAALPLLAFVRREKKQRMADIECTANITIAHLITLLGKLINFKKDLAFPAQNEAETLSGIIEELAKNPAEKNPVSIRLVLWPELPFALDLPDNRIYSYAGATPDVIQLLKMLEHNLAELRHMLRQRNQLIVQMNTHQAAKGVLPLDLLQLYMTYAADIGRNTDENLFFIDKAIGKVRTCATGLLPKRRHRHIADVGLLPETGPLMPPADYIKGWIK